MSTPSYRVLLAEDNDVNAIIRPHFLPTEGWLAKESKMGDAAVQHAVRTIERPDLELMDCLMPRLDGFAATRQIRERERKLGLPRIPVIALTALSGEEDRQACLAAGMDAVLAKPFTEDDLSKTVKCWLSGVAGAAKPVDRFTVSA